MSKESYTAEYTANPDLEAIADKAALRGAIILLLYRITVLSLLIYIAIQVTRIVNRIVWG